MSKKSNGFLSGLIVGGAAAAAAALLFAPKSGKDLRDELTEKTNDFTSNENNPEFINQAISKASTLKDKAVKTSNDAFTTIKNQSSELAKKVKQSTDEDMMSFEEAMDLMDRELEEKEEDIIIDLSETTEEVAEDAEEVASDTVDEILEEVKEEE